MNNLIEQWNELIVRGNKLSRELEDFECIMHVADMINSMIAFYDGTGTTFISKVLSPEKMDEIKRVAVSALIEAKLTKEVELEKLMGRKPAYINPIFEAAVQDMIGSNVKSSSEISTYVDIPDPDPVEEKLTEIIKTEAVKIESKPVPKSLTDNDVDDVRRMYQQEYKSMKDIAEHYGVTKSVMNNFIFNHKLARYKAKDDGFLDAKVEARQGKE